MSPARLKPIYSDNALTGSRFSPVHLHTCNGRALSGDAQPANAPAPQGGDGGSYYRKNRRCACNRARLLSPPSPLACWRPAAAVTEKIFG